MHIKNREVADFFGITDFKNNGKLEVFNQRLELSTGEQDNIILLGKEGSLYDYRLKDIAEVYANIGERAMIALCQGLSHARGNGDRKWINTQGGISNFNVNIFTTLPHFDASNSIWRLQEQISTAIAETLGNFHNKGKIEIAYPFHYLLDEKKVAGHLIQAASIDKTQIFTRIGIGINTSINPPKLPENDQLAQKIYDKTGSIDLAPQEWIDFSQVLTENIISSIEGEGRHEEYLQFLNIQPGGNVSVFEDNGSTQFGKLLAQGRFIEIDINGSVILDRQSLPSGRNYHIVKN